MAREYTWKIENLLVTRSENGLIDVIKKIYWGRYVQETVNGQVYVAERHGEFLLTPADPSNFTEFQSLTYEQLCTWLEAILPVEFIDSRIDGMLDIRIQKNAYTPENLPNNLGTGHLPG